MSGLDIEYDEEFDRHIVEFGDNTRSASEVIVFTIAEITGEDPTALEPLGEVIDPDALDAIFSRSDETDRSAAHLSFQYEGYDVTLFSHGRLTLSELE